MAACSFGASSLRTSNLRLGAARIELATSKQSACGVRLPNFTRFGGLELAKRSWNGSNRCLCLPANTAQSSINSEDCSEVANSSESTSQLIPNAMEVESLLTEICDTTSIAEFELKLGGFRLYVMRDLMGETTSSPPPLTSSIIDATPEASESNGSASSPSLAITKAVSSSNGVQTLLDKAADEGLAIIRSPKVGYFRRSRTIKGKKAPPPCKEKQIVKEGQVVCYIEQLGGELPIESDVAGEVVKMLCKDGDPVGYGDSLIAILPSFPGIKMLQ